MDINVKAIAAWLDVAETAARKLRRRAERIDEARVHFGHAIDYAQTGRPAAAARSFADGLDLLGPEEG